MKRLVAKLAKKIESPYLNALSEARKDDEEREDENEADCLRYFPSFMPLFA